MMDTSDIILPRFTEEELDIANVILSLSVERRDVEMSTTHEELKTSPGHEDVKASMEDKDMEYSIEYEEIETNIDETSVDADSEQESIQQHEGTYSFGLLLRTSLMSTECFCCKRELYENCRMVREAGNNCIFCWNCHEAVRPASK